MILLADYTAYAQNDTASLIAIGIIVAGSHLLYQFVFWLVKRWGRKKTHLLPNLLQKYMLGPGHFLVLCIALSAALPFADNWINDKTYDWLRHLFKVMTIAAGGYFIARLAYLFRDLGLERYQQQETADFSYRRAQTKFQLLQRVLNAIILLGTVSLILTTFESVRQIGSTLLASAGVAGIIIGFAAQRSLSSLFAGIQIAISQPIRIGDTVVVEDEFATIGEINLTYVVLNIWDGRRKIVPINYFLEKSFENWTRVSPQVVGKVKVYVDYGMPLNDLRKEFKKWLNESGLWDKRTSGLLVTGCTDKVMEVRATMSAKNSDDSWDLECLIREKMITYIRENHPEALPQSRVILKDGEKTSKDPKEDHRPDQEQESGQSAG